MQCYKHPREETFVACGKCERPICPKCMVQGPAGIRCRECASLRSTTLYKVHPARLALAAVAGGTVGLIGAVILSYLSILALIVAPVYGGLVAEVVSRASGRKQGQALMAIAIGSIVVGHLLALVPEIVVLAGTTIATARNVPVPGMNGGIFAGIAWYVTWRVVGVALAISACVARMRYL